jgi:nitrate reductase gamma subunit
MIHHVIKQYLQRIFFFVNSLSRYSYIYVFKWEKKNQNISLKTNKNWTSQTSNWQFQSKRTLFMVDITFHYAFYLSNYTNV